MSDNYSKTLRLVPALFDKDTISIPIGTIREGIKCSVHFDYEICGDEDVCVQLSKVLRVDTFPRDYRSDNLKVLNLCYALQVVYVYEAA